MQPGLRSWFRTVLVVVSGHGRGSDSDFDSGFLFINLVRMYECQWTE